MNAIGAGKVQETRVGKAESGILEVEVYGILYLRDNGKECRGLSGGIGSVHRRYLFTVHGVDGLRVCLSCLPSCYLLVYCENTTTLILVGIFDLS
jgi:hypothetical protein